jgi:glycosyltransferase involved in cell wall biosynthesis
VIITTKEEGKYIGRTLRAVRRQTYRPIEIVVCDAESNDGTAAVARDCGAKVIVKISNIPQGRNIAARNSHGEILVSLDADTILPRDYVANAVRDLKQKKTDMVLGSFHPLEKSIKSEIICFLWSEFLPTFLKIFGKDVHGGGSTPVFTRKIFSTVGGYNEKMTMAEDADFTNRVYHEGKIFWDKKLMTRTSMRRFQKDGYLKWAFYWLFVGGIAVFLGKSILKRYKVIR